MKKTFLGTLFVLTILLFGMFACKNASAPKASLKSSVDSVSYAYGVSMADQGLLRFLEQVGVIESSSEIEYEYQSKIAAADSTERDALQKELQAKLDSVNRINGPRLDEFIKGLKTGFAEKEESPYAYGLSVGVQFSQQMLPQLNRMLSDIDSTHKANENQVLSGLISTIKNKQLAIDAAEAGTLVQSTAETAREAVQKRREEELKIEYADSIAAAEAFLAENGKREEVVTLPSGLQYEILKEGKGAIPTENDEVKVHYHGTLVNGKVFDSSVDRGEPAKFGVNAVIPGWTEALKLMPVGSKWRLYIPHDLAYGASQQGIITPFSTLIFDVELLGIEKK